MMKSSNATGNIVSETRNTGSISDTYNPGDAVYQNLAIPVNQLPVYIQEMKERGDGFQKEFQVSHCYGCL